MQSPESKFHSLAPTVVENGAVAGIIIGILVCVALIVVAVIVVAAAIILNKWVYKIVLGL